MVLVVPVGRYSPVNVELILVIEEVKEGDMLATSEDCLGWLEILSKFVEVLTHNKKQFRDNFYEPHNQIVDEASDANILMLLIEVGDVLTKVYHKKRNIKIVLRVQIQIRILPRIPDPGG